MEKDVKDYSSILYAKLKVVNLTREDVNLVMNVLEPSECEPAKGAMADALVKALMDKYYLYFKKKYTKLELANLLYAVITEELCEVCYAVSAAVREAESLCKEQGNAYPLEFYLSEAIKVLDTIPNNWDIFDDENENAPTVKKAMEGFLKKELLFPTPTNKMVPYPESTLSLVYVTDCSRWLAVCDVDVASFVQTYNNPVVYTSKGLMQGDMLLRLIGGLKGIVFDDFILVK